MEFDREIPIHGSNEVNKGGDAKRKGSAGRQRMTEDEGRDINDLADTFIKNFHNRLKIQLGDSMKPTSHYYNERFPSQISRVWIDLNQYLIDVNGETESINWPVL
ncbi:hypothetical protein NC653_000230 [Populus alba x Populus x berolinensis]|uniref:Uncharacterized protein n=1 Tax=Populus alba x Populus x berolinensis TaxID=444605 RepID=A0AAD6RI58_9ROSI|nr:hypothetical protein NC653_000230 [Populus alba x Populus x berolinensis]